MESKRRRKEADGELLSLPAALPQLVNTEHSNLHLEMNDGRTVHGSLVHADLSSNLTLSCAGGADLSASSLHLRADDIRAIHLPPGVHLEKLFRAKLKRVDEGRRFGGGRVKKKVDSSKPTVRLEPLSSGRVIDTSHENADGEIGRWAVPARTIG